MSRPPYPETADPTTPTDRLLSALIHPNRFAPALILVAYVSGFGGVVLSLVGNPADPRSVVGIAGVALMGVAFLALFVVSVTMVNLAADPTADGDADGRPLTRR